jgi:7-cyano-7-deazaguanine synthase
MFIDYGQAAARKESRASRAIADHYDIPLKRLKLNGVQQKSAGLIIGRNAFLILAAVMEIPHDTSILAIGIHAGTGYPDCSSPFIRKMQSLLDMYTCGVVQIGAPFLRWTKGKIWQFCRSQGVPLELTYSCEYGGKQPCGRCQSCLDLKALDAAI